MLSLILKDILLQKKQLLFGFVYMFVIILSFQSVGGVMFSFGVAVFTYMSVITSCAYEDKNKSDIMLNCLPVNRSSIVLAKYISGFAFLAIGIVFYSILISVITVADVPIVVYPISMEGVVGAIAGIALLQGLYLPIFFKMGYLKSKIVNLIFFFGFFFGASYLARLVQDNWNRKWIQELVAFCKAQVGFTAAVVMFGIFMLLALSFFTSVGFYKSREF